jgi:hypothetical protein
MRHATVGLRTDAPGTALMTPQIRYYPDHVTVRIPSGQWNEALQEQAQSADIGSDPRAVADLIASERSQPMANQGFGTAAPSVLHSDPRDDIPLTYCNFTRITICAAAFVVSSIAILATQMIGNAGHIPGFKMLAFDPKGENANLFLGIFGSAFIYCFALMNCLLNSCTRTAADAQGHVFSEPSSP